MNSNYPCFILLLLSYYKQESSKSGIIENALHVICSFPDLVLMLVLYVHMVAQNEVRAILSQFSGGHQAHYETISAQGYII